MGVVTLQSLASRLYFQQHVHWSFVWRIHLPSVDFNDKRSVIRGFVVYFDVTLKLLLNKQSIFPKVDPWRLLCDVTVMMSVVKINSASLHYIATLLASMELRLTYEFGINQNGSYTLGWYDIYETFFFHAKPWIPGGEKLIYTAVIHWLRSPLHQFARARTID